MQKTQRLDVQINNLADEINEKMIAWRRDFHKNPELGMQEYRTSSIVIEHLHSLGFDDIREKVAGTGVVGILHGGKPGPVVALRGDMDALPIEEETDVPFASKVVARWGNAEVPVMHACGHDAHTAMLMAAAEIFAKLKAEICGSIMLIFQPAEEGGPPELLGANGAELMIQEGMFDDIKPDALFGLHVNANAPRGTAGTITYHKGVSGYAMSIFKLKVKGKETHAAFPWMGTDAMVVGAQILLALQTIPSRNVDVFNNHVTVSMGSFHSGHQFNIVPDLAEMQGALRFTDSSTRHELEQRVEEISKHIAESASARASVEWVKWVPQLINDMSLVKECHESFVKATGDETKIMIGEPFALDDFSHFSEVVPSMFYFLSVAADKDDPRITDGHHKPLFYINEEALDIGLKSLLHLTFDFMYK